MTGSFASLRAVAACALLVGLAACSDPEPSGEEQRQARLDALEAEARENAENARGRSANEPQERTPELPLAFESLELLPAEANVKTEELTARVRLEPGASAFTEITYTWKVGDRELVGYKLDTLNRREGQWGAQDWITVQAFATDDQGRTAESKPAAVQIANGTPRITTDLSNIKFLNGHRLEAEDPDDDPLVWSLKAEVPGVSITDEGVIRIRNVQLAEEFKGEAVFVATDPHGAASEIHIPLSINAAKEGERNKTGEKTREADTRELTDDELLKQAEDDAKYMESLSDEEMRKVLREREAARKKSQ